MLLGRKSKIHQDRIFRMLLSFGFILQALFNREVSANTTDFSTCGWVLSHLFSKCNFVKIFLPSGEKTKIRNDTIVGVSLP